MAYGQTGAGKTYTMLGNREENGIIQRSLKVSYSQNELMITPIFQNSNENIVGISALQFFEASWGLLGRFLGLPGDLVSNIINKEAYRKLQ